MVWAAILLDGSSEDADWPKRRAAASTIHATGDSTGPAGPPFRPNGVASALSSAANPASLATGATAATGAIEATADCGAMAALLATKVGAGAVVLGLAGTALRSDAWVAVDPDGELDPDGEWVAPGEDTVNSGLAVFVDPGEAAAAECSEPAFFTGLIPACPAPVLVSDRSSASDAAAMLAGVAAVGVVPDGFDAAPAVEVEVVPDGASLLAEDSESGAAHATPGAIVTADPTPSATANAPTRPTCFAYPTNVPRRS